MASKTHYDVLGVPRDASSVDIASAFRERLADLQSKPGTDPDKIADLREAYQLLANPARRREYDAELPPPPGARRAAAPKVELPENTSRPDTGEGWWTSKPALYALPVILLVLVIIGVRNRSKEEPPRAIVPTTRIVLTPPKPPDPEEGGEGKKAEAEAPVVPAAAATPTAPMSAEDIFAAASPSVVRVFASDRSGAPIAQGSGVVIAPGHIVTNCHVTRGAAKVEVKSASTMRPAHAGVSDDELDLCSLNVAGLDAPPLRLGSLERLRTGQRVYAIGAPLGLELTISEGIVSALREVQAGKGPVIQTTAPISPGSSGGGLFDAQGQLIGIVTFQARAGQNLNFALPVDWLADMRPRETAAAAPAAEPEPRTTADLLKGSWHCFAALSGITSQYEFRANGRVTVSGGDGPGGTADYRLTGSNIRFNFDGQGHDLRIETITEDRMVLFVSEGNRLACQRR